MRERKQAMLELGVGFPSMSVGCLPPSLHTVNVDKTLGCIRPKNASLSGLRPLCFFILFFSFVYAVCSPLPLPPGVVPVHGGKQSRALYSRNREPVNLLFSVIPRLLSSVLANETRFT